MASDLLLRIDLKSYQTALHHASVVPALAIDLSLQQYSGTEISTGREIVRCSSERVEFNLG